MDGGSPYTDAGTEALAAIVEPAETSMVLKLRKPLMPGRQGEVTELHLTEPTAGQWIASTAFGSDAELQLLALVTKVPAPVLREMAISDFTKAARFLVGFANVSPPTGNA